MVFFILRQCLQLYIERKTFFQCLIRLFSGKKEILRLSIPDGQFPEDLPLCHDIHQFQTLFKPPAMNTGGNGNCICVQAEHVFPVTEADRPDFRPVSPVL